MLSHAGAPAWVCMLQYLIEETACKSPTCDQVNKVTPSQHARLSQERVMDWQAAELML